MILKKYLFNKKTASLIIGLGSIAGMIAYPQYAPFIDKGIDVIYQTMIADVDNGSDTL